MRIGFDVDGVLANFIPAYQRLVLETVEPKVNLFQPGDDVEPPTWNWPELRGYRPETMKEVWGHIANGSAFWESLRPLPDCETLRMCLPGLSLVHDIYFITSRPGATAKRQTERWLLWYLPFGAMSGGTGYPTVLISSDKGAAAKALKLDFYIDDYYKNALSVAEQSPSTRNYLLRRRYNAEATVLPESIIQVDTLGQALDYENLAGRL